MATRIQFASRPHVDYELSIPDKYRLSENRPHLTSEELRTQTVNPFEASQKAPRRDRVQILLKMLQAASVPIKKTHLMYGAGINFYQLEKHLTFLLGSGMIEEVTHEDGIGFRTTEKGRLFSDLFA